MPNDPWRSCETFPKLRRGCVQVWRVRPSRLPLSVDDWGSLLTHEEQTRAASYRFDKDRHLFIAGRALLRRLLGRALDISPTAVDLGTTALGKLHLATSPPAADGPLEFNVTHSGDVVLLALAYDMTLGIDVERVRNLSRLEQLAQHYFSPQECQQLFSLPEQGRQAAFFQAWTRKEAILKASGKGLTFALNEVEVTLAPGEPPRLLRYGKMSGSAAPWRLVHLDVGDGYVAALAVDRYPVSLCLLDFAGEYPAS